MVLLLASIILLAVIPHQVETTEGPNLTPAFIPTVMAIAIAGLSAVLAIQGLIALRTAHRAAPARPRQFGLRGLFHVAAVIAVVAVQTALLTRLGYLGATGIAIALLAVLYGHRSWWQIALLAIVAPPAVIIFFRYTMLVLLPEGSWFE